MAHRTHVTPLQADAPLGFEGGAKSGDLARKHGVSEATLYNWKAKCGGLDISEAKGLDALEDENRKLKKLLAESMPDNAALNDLLKKIVGPAAKREAMRASGLYPGCADRTMIRYRSRRPADTALRARVGQRAPPLRLSTTVRPAPKRGRAVRHQSDLSSLPRGEVDRAHAPCPSKGRGLG